MTTATKLAEGFEICKADYDDLYVVKVQFCGEMGKPDKYGDIFLPGSYKAKAEVPMADWNHSRTRPIGVGRIEPYKKAMAWVGELTDLEALRLIRKMGASQEWSYTFDPKKYKERQDTEHLAFEFSDVEVYEVSPVFRAASYGTHTVKDDWRKELKGGLPIVEEDDNIDLATILGIIANQGSKE